MPALLEGTWLTIRLTLGSVAVGIFLGLLLALARISKNVLLDNFAKFYIWFFRGTPLLLQIFFVYYALPTLLPMSISNMTAAYIALSLNSGAYLSALCRQRIGAYKLEDAVTPEVFSNIIGFL